MSLLAMTELQATHVLNVNPLSRAGSLLQGAVVTGGSWLTLLRRKSVFFLEEPHITGVQVLTA
ncbi:hypothetical protein EMIT0232MI5_120116 [Pseudomonas sp. IT-232MI5]